MNKLIHLLFGLFFIGSMPLAGQSPQIEFTEFDLDNGLHVILHQDNTTPIVVVSVLYHVGSKNENPNRTGFAHFFEHLMFEGSENVGRGEFDKYIDGSGGTNNAYTTFDRTYYYETMPSNQLEMALWLESERMLHAKVDMVGVETQREVVKEEKRQRYDNQPYGDILIQTMKRLFYEHPYRWMPIGSLDHLNAASIDDFVTFYNTFYVPNNATLTIAGDFEEQKAKELIEKYFQEIPEGTLEIPRPEIIEPPLEREVRDTIFDNIQLPAIIQAYRTPPMGTDDFYALDMATKVLADGASSRLYNRLVDEEKLAVYATSLQFELEDPGVFLNYAVANAGKSPAEIEAIMDEEVSKMKNELITEQEYLKIRNQIENDFVNSVGSLAGIAQNLALYHVHLGEANLINTELERYLRVTREDIQAAAQKYLTLDQRVVLYYLAQENQ